MKKVFVSGCYDLLHSGHVEFFRQAEWEAYVAQFQGCSVNARSDEKWRLMEKIFDSNV